MIRFRFCVNIKEKSSIFSFFSTFPYLKYIIYILTLYISFLSVHINTESGLLSNAKESTIETACNKECCGINKHSKSKKTSKDCCPNGACNPFQSCGCCFGFQISEFDFQFFSLSTSNKSIYTSLSNELSNYHSDYFHPPEFAS